MFGTAVFTLVSVLQIQVSVSGWWCDYYWGDHDPDTYDPCLEGNHHQITDPTRSADYYDPSSPLLHDDYDYFHDYDEAGQKNGWYRSVIPGAEDIALARPENGHCQAKYQLYLDVIVEGSYHIYDYWEAEEYYAIELTHSEYGCCYGAICMKHCDNFNVYQLGPHYYWHWDYESRLCFGGGGQCREGDEVCNKLFKNRNRPTISYNTVEKELGNDMCKEEAEFVCQVTKWVNASNINKLSFIWTVSDIVIHQEEKLGSEQLSTLTMEQIQSSGITQGNIELECSVRWSTNTNGDTFGKPVNTTFNMGLHISQTSIEMVEGQHPERTVLTSTVPLGCEYPCSEGESHVCNVDIQVTYPTHGTNQIALQFDENYVDTGVCDTTLNVRATANFGATLNVPISIYPKDDGKYDGTQQVDIQFQLVSSNNLWNGLTYGIDVLVHDINSDYGRGARCSFTNDPHLGNFDGSYFELQLPGTFKVMRHLNFPIDIEAYFKDYHGYTGVCGVAVRSGDNFFLVEYCEEEQLITRSAECDSSTSLIVKRLGRQYHIYLLTGTRVEITEGRMNIYPSAADKDRVEGICGNYNDDRSDDFRIKDTDEYDPNTYEPNTFSESWRTGEESLFSGEINDHSGRQFEDQKFCECDAKGVQRCSRLPRNTNNVKGSDILPGSHCKEFKRSIVYSDFVAEEDELVLDYNPDFVAPQPEWKNGWSEDTATEFCNNYFSSEDVLQSCEELIDIESGQSNCVQDIFITGTTNYTKTQVDMLLSQCINEVEKYDLTDVSNNNSYTNPYQEVLESVCYSNCNGNGQCENGVCQCDHNYAGHDCSVDKNHIPTLRAFHSDGLCDKVFRPCQDVAVYADLFLDSDNLKCLVQAKDISYSVISEPVTYTGMMEHFQKMFCHVPEHTMPYIVSIAVTNNDRNYSEPEHLLVYHSTCWQCSLDSGCEKKKSSCIIDNDCIAAGESNPSNPGEYCDPDLDEYGWSKVSAQTTTGQQKFSQGAIIGVSVAAAIVIIAIIIIIIVVCKHKSNKRADRVRSEVDLGKAHPVGPMLLEQNQNGMPPTKAQFDFKTMNLYPDVKPNNRLRPLTPSDCPQVTLVRPADNPLDQPDPIALKVDTLPDAKVEPLNK